MQGHFNDDDSYALHDHDLDLDHDHDHEADFVLILEAELGKGAFQSGVDELQDDSLDYYVWGLHHTFGVVLYASSAALETLLAYISLLE